MRCDECLRSIPRHATEVFLSFGVDAFGRHACSRRYFCALPCLLWWLFRELGVRLGWRDSVSIENTLAERQRSLKFPEPAPKTGIVRVGGMAVARRRSRRAARPDPDSPQDPRGSRR